MNLYNRFILPRLIDFAMRQKYLQPLRAKAAGAARGRVLEIGIGSGLNLSLYGQKTESLCGIDPSPELLEKARQRATSAPFPVRLVEGSSEKLPFDDRCFDTIVMTFTLCSIRDPSAAARELRRVLKSDGELIFAEHGRAPDPSVVRWQERLTPIWRRLAGGCHLNRKIDELIVSAGFSIVEMDARYSAFPKLLGYFFSGT